MQLSMLTHDIYSHLYTDISEFRKTFDLPCNDPESLTSDADCLHTSLIIEELTELAEADSKIEQADAIIDSVYVLMGRLVHLGSINLHDHIEITYLIDLFLNVAQQRKINFLACWNEIHSSNMSKACVNEEEFSLTQAFYAQQGVEISATKQGDVLIAKCSKNTTLSNKSLRKGKVLKSVNYRPANLEPILHS